MTTDTKSLQKKINKEYKVGNVKSAIELCQIGLQEDPTNADLHLRLGDLYLAWHLDIYNSAQYIDEAITEYQRAMETYIDSPEIYYKIGRAHYYKGDLDKAINYLNKEKYGKLSRLLLKNKDNEELFDILLNNFMFVKIYLGNSLIDETFSKLGINVQK